MSMQCITTAMLSDKKGGKLTGSANSSHASSRSAAVNGQLQTIIRWKVMSKFPRNMLHGVTCHRRGVGFKFGESLKFDGVLVKVEVEVEVEVEVAP